MTLILSKRKYLGSLDGIDKIENITLVFIPMQDTQVQSLGWEDPLEEGMATHSSVLAWKIPMDRGAWWATVHGSQRVGHD